MASQSTKGINDDDEVGVKSKEYTRRWDRYHGASPIRFGLELASNSTTCDLHHTSKPNMLPEYMICSHAVQQMDEPISYCMGPDRIRGLPKYRDLSVS